MGVKTRVTSFKLNKYGLATAYLDTMDENGELHVFVLDQEGYDSEAFLNFPVSPKISPSVVFEES